MKCTFCEGATSFHNGLEGGNADHKKILVVAHKPDLRVARQLALEGFDSYSLTLSQTKTGKNMTKLLNHCGLGWGDIYWTNLFKCALPNDRSPRVEEYRRCLTRLEAQIDTFEPELILAMGRQVYQYLFPERFKKKGHKKSVGDTYLVGNARCLIFPHPQVICHPYCNQAREKELFDLAKNFLGFSLLPTTND